MCIHNFIEKQKHIFHQMQTEHNILEFLVTFRVLFLHSEENRPALVNWFF